MRSNATEEGTNSCEIEHNEQQSQDVANFMETAESASLTERLFFSASDIYSDDSDVSFVSIESNFWGEYKEVLEVDESDEEESDEELDEDEEENNEEKTEVETCPTNAEKKDIQKKSMAVIFHVIRDPSPDNPDFLPFNIVRECVPWRMNLMACSTLQPNLVYVACDDTIVVFHLDHSKLQCSKELQRITLRPRSSLSSTRSRSTINYILVSFLGVYEVLLAADDVGRVHLWLTSSLTNSVILDAAPRNSSVWGLDLHPDTWILAASSNSHAIKLMDLHILNPFSNFFPFPSFSSFPSWRSSSSSNTPTLGVPNGIRYFLGHEHNIPSVAFNKVGNLLASSSIDCTIRIWEVSTGECIRCIQCAQWMWQVRFFPFPTCSLLSPNDLDEHVVCTGDAGLEVFNVYQKSDLIILQPSASRTRPWSSWLGSVDRINMMFVFESCILALHQSGKLLYLPLMPNAQPSFSDPKRQFEFLELPLPFPSSSPILGCFVQLKSDQLSVRVFITFFDADALILDIQPIVVHEPVPQQGPSVRCSRHNTPFTQSEVYNELLRRISGELCA